MPTPLLDNRQLGSDTARLNQLTNGGFELWQRGVGPFTANGAYSADRWVMTNNGGTSTWSISRDNTNQDVVGSGWFCAAVSYTHGSTVCDLIQKMENPLEFRGRTVSLSMRVRASVANGVRICIMDDTQQVFSSYHPGGGVYQTLTCSATLGASVGTVQVFVRFGVSGTYYLDNAMFVFGSQPADYAPLHPADDFARCARYYEGLQLKPWSGYANGSTQASMVWPFIRKAVSPTLTKLTTWSVTNCTANLSYNHVDGMNIIATITTTGMFQVAPVGGNDFCVEANP